MNKWPKIRLGLLPKIAAVATTGVLLLAALLVVLYSRQLQRTAEDGLAKRARAIAAGLASECEYGLAIGNKQLLLNAATKVLTQPDVVSAVVFDENGKLMASAGKVNVTVKTRTGPALVAKYKNTTVLNHPDALQPLYGDVQLFYVPVFLEPASLSTIADLDVPAPENGAHQQVGLVELVISDASTALAIQRAHHSALALTFLAALVVCLLCFIGARRMVRPLRTLVAGTEQLAAGNLTARVTGTTRDEIGDLAQAFNSMAQTLEQSHQEIVDHQRHLERRVRERTGELQEANSQLAVELKERQRIETALREGEQSFRLMFANNPLPMWVHDLETLRFLEVNESAIAHYGYSREEFLAMTIKQIRPVGEVARLEKHLSEFRPGMVDTGEWRHCLKNGVLIDVNVLAHTLEFRGRTGVLVVAQDVTQRKRAEAEIAERTAVALLGSDVGAVLIQNAPLHDLLQGCTDAIIEHLDGALARIWTYEEKDKMLEMQASSGLYTNINDEYARIPAGEHKVGLIAQELQPHLTNCVVGDPQVRDQEWARREGIVAFAGYPLLVDDRLTGVVALFARNPLSALALQALGGIASQIALSIERKRAEMELQDTHRQLLDTSRRAGMAEVATNVLHNVGNVLNSVNTSSAVVADKLRNFRTGNLMKAVELMKAHERDLPMFLTQDPKGRQLLDYMVNLASSFERERKNMLNEVDSLTAHVGHVKEIVAMQQSYAKASGLVELLRITDVIEDALRFNEGGLVRHHINVLRQYDKLLPIYVDKHKVMQILINLVRNAKYAMDDGPKSEKRLTLKVEETPANMIRISVIDNGIGIPPEIRNRIFEHGFTTRKNGHGFGLHSGAIAARELGGGLLVHSDGLGKGATFTLEIPAKRTA